MKGEAVEVAAVDLVQLRQPVLVRLDVLGGLVRADQFASPNLPDGDEKFLPKFCRVTVTPLTC